MRQLFVCFCILLLMSTLFQQIKPVRAGQTVYHDISIYEDTYNMQNFPTLSPWDDPYLFTGTDSQFGKGKTRIFMRPSWQQLKNLNIKPLDILHAELHLYQTTEFPALETVQLDIATPYMAWDVYNFKWNEQISSGIPLDHPEITNDIGQKMIPMTNTARDSYDFFLTKFINKGISVRMPQEHLAAQRFYSIDCTTSTSCTPNQKPFIRIFIQKNNAPTACVLASPKIGEIKNTANIVLKATGSADPDGDKLSYSARICKDIRCIETIWDGPISSTTNTTVPITSGNYIAECTTDDNYGGRVTGPSHEFTIDTLVPAAPKLLPYSEFSALDNYTVSWLPSASEELLTYQVLYSERSTFSAYNTYTEWSSETSAKITLAKEKTYYFKARAKDLAGNISDWSETGKVTLDTAIPKINYFKTNRTVITPKKNSSNGAIENAAYIQGSIDDDTISHVTISIYNEVGDTIFSKSTSEKNYLWLHWPDSLEYPDGKYTAQLQGIDALGNTIISSPIVLAIDTTPPPKAQIFGISNNAVYRTSQQKVQAICTDSIGSFYLSGKLLKTGERNFNTEFKQNDGTFTFEATCTDDTGNKSSEIVRYTIDSTPPTAPSLTLTYNEQENAIYGKVYCRESGKLEFSELGNLIATQECSSGKYVEIKLREHIVKPSTQRFSARLSDLAGNQSNITEQALYIEAKYSPPEEQKAKEKLFCRVAYNIDTSKQKEVECSWPTMQTPKYIKSELIEPAKYKSTFQTTGEYRGTLFYSVLVCKKRDIFDPRTWFSCVEQMIETNSIPLQFIPITFTSYSYLHKQENTYLLNFFHTEASIANLMLGFVAQTSYTVGNNSIVFQTNSSPSIFAQKLSLPEKLQSPSLGWIFATSKEVTQWYGNTAYQKPHQGIDFAVTKEAIYVPANGKVVSITYDQSNSCNAGGNYLAIKHDNGLYSYYFHLDSLQNPQTNAKNSIGDMVKAGNRVAVSGNSGMYNCLPLAYHLHFEIRTSQSPNSHTNPVPYMNVNWATIATANPQTYPGRLTGENPHPTY